MSRDCCVALSHDAMGLSAFCDCDISDHTRLLFIMIYFKQSYILTNLTENGNIFF